MIATNTAELTLSDLGRVIYQRRKLAATLFFGCVAASLLAIWLWPRQYQSESKIYIRLGRESASLDPTAMVGRPNAQPSLSWTRENEINSVLEILISRVLLERVVDAVGPESILGRVPLVTPDPTRPHLVRASALPALTAEAQPATGGGFLGFEADWLGALSARERAIIKLRKNLNVYGIKKSDVVRVTYESRNPELSQTVVNHLVDFYLAEHLRLNRTSGAHEFLNKQTDETRVTLASAEEALRALRDRTGVTSVEAQRTIMVTRAGRLQDELLATEAQLKSAEAELQVLRDTQSGMPRTMVTGTTVGMPNHGVELMSNELYRLRLLEQELTSKYTDEHTYVKQIRQRVAEAQRVLDSYEPTHEQITNGSNTLYEQAGLAMLKLEPQLHSLRAKKSALQAQLEQVSEEIKTLNANEVQLSQLTRDVARHEATFKAYAEHREQARIDQALEEGQISSISIIQPATLEPKATSPRIAMLLSLGVLLGLIGAIAAPLAVESFAPPYRAPRDAEHTLGAATLATIPRFAAEQLSGEGHSS